MLFLWLFKALLLFDIVCNEGDEKFSKWLPWLMFRQKADKIKKVKGFGANQEKQQQHSFIHSLNHNHPDKTKPPTLPCSLWEIESLICSKRARALQGDDYHCASCLGELPPSVLFKGQDLYWLISAPSSLRLFFPLNSFIYLFFLRRINLFFLIW